MMKLAVSLFGLMIGWSLFANELELPEIKISPRAKTPTFSEKVTNELKAVEGNIDKFKKELETLLGTASHGFLPVKNCVPTGKHVGEMLRLKQIAATAVLEQKSSIKEFSNQREWISFLRPVVAQDLLATTHIWTTKANTLTLWTLPAPKADIIFSWQHYNKATLNQKDCLTYSKALHHLIAASIYHQNSWLVNKLSISQVNHLAHLFLHGN